MGLLVRYDSRQFAHDDDFITIQWDDHLMIHREICVTEEDRKPRRSQTAGMMLIHCVVSEFNKNWDVVRSKKGSAVDQKLKFTLRKDGGSGFRTSFLWVTETETRSLNPALMCTDKFPSIDVATVWNRKTLKSKCVILNYSSAAGTSDVCRSIIYLMFPP